MNHFIKRLIPFMLIGIAIVAFALGIMLLAYIFLIGALVGLILFLISWIRDKLFPTKSLKKTAPKKSGRIIDVDTWKKS